MKTVAASSEGTLPKAKPRKKREPMQYSCVIVNPEAFTYEMKAKLLAPAVMKLIIEQREKQTNVKDNGSESEVKQNGK